MSFFLDYARGLAGIFKKASVADSCTQTSRSIREHTLPALELAAKNVKSKKLSSDVGSEFVKAYEKEVGRVGGSIFTDMAKLLENAADVLDKISTSVGERFSETESGMALTFNKVNTLRLIETATFLDDYSQRLLNRLVVEETRKVAPESVGLSSVAPAELVWLQNNEQTFFIAAQTFRDKPEAILKKLADVPEALVSSQAEAVLSSTASMAKLDPFRTRHFTVTVNANPFYLLGMMVARFQAQRYKTKQERLELLQMRLLNLKKAEEKNQDGHLQAQIERMQDRVNTLQLHLEEKSEQYGV